MVRQTHIYKRDKSITEVYQRRNRDKKTHETLNRK